MSTGRRRVVLIAVAVAWTLGAGITASLLLERPPRVLEVGGHPYFLAGVGEVVWPWLLGLMLLLGLAVPRPDLRKGTLALTAFAGAALPLVVLTTALQHRPPRKIDTQDIGDVGSERITLLVAVDGMSWTAILPMVRRGDLPTIRRLMEEGTYGVLHSLESYRETEDQWGYWSPVVWTSIATGVEPRRHGIVDFTIGEGRWNRQVAASYHRKAPAFWNLFSAFGRTVGVVGWWATWPAEEVAGVMASSHLGLRGARRGPGPRDGLAFPEALSKEFRAAGLPDGELRRWVHETVFRFDSYPIVTAPETRTLYSVLWQDRLYQDIALALIRNRERLDLYAVYFEGIDALSHHFWAAMQGEEVDVPASFPENFDAHREVVPGYYRVVDGFLAELLAELPDDVTVLVVSDHGFEVDPHHSKRADHGAHGVLLARGPGISQGKNLNLDLPGSLRERLHGTTDVLDVLPTLLYLHGLPVAKDLPGAVLSALFTEAFLDAQPLVEVESYGRYDGTIQREPLLDPAASDEYEERLRALGYTQ